MQLTQLQRTAIQRELGQLSWVDLRRYKRALRFCLLIYQYIHQMAPVYLIKTSVSETIQKPPLVKAQTALKKPKK